jgi:hypothetical protein
LVRPSARAASQARRQRSSGHLLVVTADGKLLAAPFDPDKLAVTGPAVGILEGLRSGRSSRTWRWPGTD